MSTRNAEYPFPGPYPYEGLVRQRDNRGRVRAEIPGREGLTGWLRPRGMPGGGRADHGAVIAPPEGALIDIVYVNGDRENGRYLTGPHPVDGEPVGTEVTEDGDRIVWRDGRVQIVVDGRAASTVRVEDQAADGAGVLLEVDIANRRLRISSALGIEIETSGLLDLDGGTVRINGRTVAPQGPPI